MDGRVGCPCSCSSFQVGKVENRSADGCPGDPSWESAGDYCVGDVGVCVAYHRGGTNLVVDAAILAGRLAAFERHPKKEITFLNQGVDGSFEFYRMAP